MLLMVFVVIVDELCPYVQHDKEKYVKVRTDNHLYIWWNMQSIIKNIMLWLSKPIW
jgi:hypothetical protein